MDIYCKRCGEPWDCYGALHGMDMTREEYQRMMAGDGCPCCFGKPVEKRPLRGELMAIAADLLGDDVDGIASTMDDAEFMFGSEFWE